MTDSANIFVDITEEKQWKKVAYLNLKYNAEIRKYITRNSKGSMNH